jgi:hypothetical protein
MVRQTVLRVLTFMLATLAATSCWANALTQGDWMRLEDIYGKTATFAQELGAVARASSPPAECVQVLVNTTSRFLGEMDKLNDLVAIDVGMIDQRDEAVVLRYLQTEIKRLPNGIAIDRREINAIMSQCGSNGVVAAECQELLRLHDAAASFVDGVSRKLGP